MADDSTESETPGGRVPSVLVPLALTFLIVLVGLKVFEGSAPAPTDDRKQARVTVVGDIGSDAQAATTLEMMSQAGPAVHLALGDLSYAGPGSEPQWCELVRSSVGETPFQIVAGNHEDDTGQDGRIENFARCLPDRMASVGLYGREYYFDVGKLARVIMISPDLTIEGEHFFYGERTPNRRWLEAAIDGAKKADIGWVIVGMHKNCISVGEYYCDVHQELFSFLIDRGVDLVLSAHDHTYQRSKQLATPGEGCPEVKVDSYQEQCVVDDGTDGRYGRGQGTVFVISGAGGGNLYDIHDDDAEARYFAAVMGKNRSARTGFLELEITAERIAGEFVGTSPGSFSDKFALVEVPQ